MFEMIMGSRAGGFGMVRIVTLHSVPNSSIEYSCSLVSSVELVLILI
jgi:hypothetical protein